MSMYVSILIALIASPGGSPDNLAKLAPVSDEVINRFGLVDPQVITLQPDQPLFVTHPPPRTGLLWGQFQFGPAAALRTVAVAVDESNPAAPLIFVDANGDGDLTNDATLTWDFIRMPNGQPSPSARETFVKLTGEPGAATGGHAVRFYRFTSQEALLRKLPTNALYCQCPAAAQGDAVVGGRKYAAALLERSSVCDFTFPNGRGAELLFLLDLNGDSNFGADQRFAVDKPFKVGDVVYEVASITADGASVSLKKSERPLNPTHRGGPPAVGDIAPAFTGPGLDGNPVNFPGDYKGKLVLIDFWATWCGPCVAEIPNVKAAYAKYHKKGLEVLGISFDQANMSAQLKKFTQAKGMTWRQLYDGKFWNTQVGQQWKIGGIPAMFLIDGDTGKILAAGMSFRGENLDPTIGLEIKNKFERQEK